MKKSAQELKNFMSSLATKAYEHISSTQITNSSLTLEEMVKSSLQKSRDTNTVNSFSALCELLDYFEKDTVSIGIIYNNNKSHFVVFYHEYIFDIALHCNTVYSDSFGYLRCCHKLPIPFMENNFKKGTLIRYETIKDWSIQCSDYFSKGTILYSPEEMA